jgi:hypothetical protein
MALRLPLLVLLLCSAGRVCSQDADSKEARDDSPPLSPQQKLFLLTGRHYALNFMGELVTDDVAAVGPGARSHARFWRSMVP